MDDSPRFRFGFRFVLLARQWRRVLDHELAALGFSDAGWTLLYHLDHGGDGITQNDLAERMGLDGSSLVRVIDLLEERGLIERRIDPADRRARRLFVTAGGHDAIATIRARLRVVEAEMLRDADDASLGAALETFDRIAPRLAALDPKAVKP